MKPTKVRNYQIYRATMAIRSKQLGSPLSKDLQKKYGKRSMRVILGDTVKVMRGEYRGVDGKISKVSIADNSVAIEGVKKEKSKGEKFDVLIRSTNVVITNLNLDDHWRKTKLEGKKPKTTPKEAKPESLKEAKLESPKEAKLELPKKDKPKKEVKKDEPKETPKEETKKISKKSVKSNTKSKTKPKLNQNQLKRKKE
ncbi:MAG: 50S ribosomal protein L24 [Thaumarchaeota archaeon]|nr:50S ribosomal protein L24 [Nitrososphaerota archaeon]